MTPIKLSPNHAQPDTIWFQSLFFWMTPIKGPRRNGWTVTGRVSILVLLDDSHQVCHRFGGYVERLVSILVLLDDSHQGRRISCSPKAAPVSILVLLDDSHQAGRKARNPRLDRVSILVLLDDSHQGHNSNCLRRMSHGFNPCSSG